MEILWVVISLIGVLGLFFVLIYALKKLNNGLSIISGSKMRVIDRVSVGKDGMILVVSVCGKLMLMSSTPHHIEKIADLDMTPDEYLAQLQSGAQGTTMSFKEALGNVLKRNGAEGPGKDGEDV